MAEIGTDTLQRLYDSEINFELSSFWDGGFIWRLDSTERPGGIRLLEAVGMPSESSDAFAARMELARIFSHGVGIPVDARAALKWYSAAIKLATDDEDSEDLREARAYIAQTRQ